MLKVRRLQARIRKIATEGWRLSMISCISPKLFHTVRTIPFVGHTILPFLLDVWLPPNSRLTRRINSGPLTGMMFELDPHALDIIIGRYEDPVQTAIPRMLNEGSVAYDVGAHFGYFTLVMALVVGKGGRVFAFEPNPLPRKVLIDNLRRNSPALEAAVTPIHAALCAAPGSTGFKVGPWSARGKIGDTTTSQFRIDTMTLDQAAARFGVPQLIKIDVEGAETEVLLGGMALLAETRPSLIIETHSPEQLSQCTSILRKLGYRCRHLREPGRKQTYLIASPGG